MFRRKNTMYYSSGAPNNEGASAKDRFAPSFEEWTGFGLTEREKEGFY